APRERLGVTLGEHLDRGGADRDAVAGDLHLVGQDAVRAVVLQEVGVDLGRGEVVDRDHLDVRPALARRPEVVAPDAAEAVDADTYRHCCLLGRPYRFVLSASAVAARPPTRAKHELAARRDVTQGALGDPRAWPACAPAGGGRGRGRWAAPPAP